MPASICLDTSWAAALPRALAVLGLEPHLSAIFFAFAQAELVALCLNVVLAPMEQAGVLVPKKIKIFEGSKSWPVRAKFQASSLGLSASCQTSKSYNMYGHIENNLFSNMDIWFAIWKLNAILNGTRLCVFQLCFLVDVGGPGKHMHQLCLLFIISASMKLPGLFPPLVFFATAGPAGSASFKAFFTFFLGLLFAFALLLFFFVALVPSFTSFAKRICISQLLENFKK